MRQRKVLIENEEYYWSIEKKLDEQGKFFGNILSVIMEDKIRKVFVKTENVSPSLAKKTIEKYLIGASNERPRERVSKGRSFKTTKSKAGSATGDSRFNSRVPSKAGISGGKRSRPEF